MAQETVQQAELAEVQDRVDSFYSMLSTQNVWGHDRAGLLAIKAAMQMLSTKTGIYARIPLFCKGKDCPYEESCQLQQYGIAPENQACPVEVAQIQRKYVNYCTEFDLDSDEASFTDKNLVNEIITMEIYMERCKALMSKEGNPVQMIMTGVSESGDIIEQPAVSKAFEAYEKFSKKRNDNYNLLMATRKDKKKDSTDKNETIIDIMTRAEQKEDFYDIEQRPEHIPGVDDVKEVKQE